MSGSMDTSSTIHPTAVIDSTAELDDDVFVGPGCVIGPRVRIGSGSELLNHVTIQSDTTIGSNNRFYPFSVVGADPQDKKFDGERTTLSIGDDNLIREHVTIHRGTGNGGGKTVIGSDNLLMVGSHVAHDCHLGDDIVIANQVMLAGHIVIDDGASIGGGAGVHHFATIGRCSFVAGLARVTRDVPPFMLVEGQPAEVRSANVIAMRRRGYADQDIEAIKEAYKRLFRDNGGAMLDRVETLLAECAGINAIVHLCESIKLSSEGRHGRGREAMREDDKWKAASQPTG